ncbi:MAG: hypothetical protein R3C97_17995 [Geminicoccaceae bacterium]
MSSTRNYKHGRWHDDALTVTGKTYGENQDALSIDVDRKVIRAYDEPMMPEAGFVIISRQHLRQRRDEDLRHHPGIQRTKYMQDGGFEAARSSSRARRTAITTASTTRALDIDETVFCSSAIASRVGYPGARSGQHEATAALLMKA